MLVDAWTIPGSEGHPILGNCHHATGSARGVVILVHGFKGYKDYGMFPWLATRLSAAGLVTHRFNFSHSGMTNRIDTFERPDLFERDTWDRQVHDLLAIVDALRNGVLPGSGLPVVLFGHSRGGVTCLLFAGRHAETHGEHLTGIITAATPAATNRLSDDDQQTLLREGRFASPSARTGQTLYIGADWLQTQRDDPAGHDLATLLPRIVQPITLIHGDADETVPVADVHTLHALRKTNTQVVIVPGANHVFSAPNPMNINDNPPTALNGLLHAVHGSINEWLP